MNLLEQLQAENAALKASLQQKDEKLVSLEKLNSWYIDQPSLFDLFNETETLREPITVEPTEDTIIPAHKRKKSKRGASFTHLPVELIEYELDESERICDVCGDALTEMKKEVRKELKIVLPRLV